MKKNSIKKNRVLVVIVFSSKTNGIMKKIVNKWGFSEEDLVPIPIRLGITDEKTRQYISIFINKGCDDDAVGCLELLKDKSVEMGTFNLNLFPNDVREDILKLGIEKKYFNKQN